MDEHIVEEVEEWVARTPGEWLEVQIEAEEEVRELHQYQSRILREANDARWRMTRALKRLREANFHLRAKTKMVLGGK